MAKYRHKGSMHVFEKEKTKAGDVIGGIIVCLILFAALASCAG